MEALIRMPSDFLKSYRPLVDDYPSTAWYFDYRELPSNPNIHYDPYLGLNNSRYNGLTDTYEEIRLPEVEVRPQYKSLNKKDKALRNAEGRKGGKYVRQGMESAMSLVAPIVFSGVASAVSSVGALWPMLDFINLGYDPTNPINYIPVLNRLNYKNIGKVADIATRTKSYTGVPPRYTLDAENTMNNEFLNKDVDVWTTSNPDHAKLYAEFNNGNGTIFTIFGHKNKLAVMPKLDKDVKIIWSDMPYIFNDGKFLINPLSMYLNSEDYGILYTDINGKVVPYRFRATKNLTNAWKVGLKIPFPITESLTTASLFNSAKLNGYEGIQFRNIIDLDFISNGIRTDAAVNEYAYRKGANIIKTPFGTTKLDLISLYPILSPNFLIMTPLNYGANILKSNVNE